MRPRNISVREVVFNERIFKAYPIPDPEVLLMGKLNGDNLLEKIPLPQFEEKVRNFYLLLGDFPKSPIASRLPFNIAKNICDELKGCRSNIAKPPDSFSYPIVAVPKDLWKRVNGII